MRLPPKNPCFRHGVPRTLDGIALTTTDTAEEDARSKYDFSDIGRCNTFAASEVDVDELWKNDEWENFGNDWLDNNDGNSDFMSIYTFDDETIKTDFQSTVCGGIVLEGVPEDVGEDLKKKRKRHKKELKKEAATSASDEIEAFPSASKSFKGEETDKGETTIIKDIKQNFEPATPKSPNPEEPKVKDLIHVWSKQARIQRRKDAKVRKLISTYNTIHHSGNSSVVGSVCTLGSRLSMKKMPSQKRYAPAAVLTAATTPKKSTSPAKKSTSPARSHPDSSKKSSHNQKNTPARSSPKKSSQPAKQGSSPTKGLLKRTYRGLATIIEQSNVTPSNNFWKQREERQKKEKALTKGRGWKFWKAWSKPKASQSKSVGSSKPVVEVREVLDASFSATSVTSGSDEEENLVQQRVREWPMQEVEGDNISVYSRSVWC